MPTIDVNGASYHYRRRGTGPAVILLHGFAGSSASWLELMGSLAPHADTIAVDLLGHGLTEVPDASLRYAMEAAANDIVTLASRLGIDQFHLLGYSMGGRLALCMALRYPAVVSSLVLESASPGIAGRKAREERRQSDAALAKLIEDEGVEAFVAHWEQLPLFASQQRLPELRKARLRQERLNNKASGLANSLLGMGSGSQPSLWPMLPELRMPVLLICGALDQKFVDIATQMALLTPEASLRIVPDAGHAVHLEQPFQFLLLVTEFLRQGNRSLPTISRAG